MKVMGAWAMQLPSVSVGFAARLLTNCEWTGADCGVPLPSRYATVLGVGVLVKVNCTLKQPMLAVTW
jgi:hypothetical protein